MKLQQLFEAEGGTAAVDVADALQLLDDQGVDNVTIELYQTLCTKLIKTGADVTVLEGQIEFAMPFFNISMVTVRGEAGFKMIFLDDVEDFVLELHTGSNALVHSIPLVQAAAIDWQYLNKALYETKKLRDYLAKALKR